MNYKLLNQTLKKINRELRAENHDLKGKCKGLNMVIGGLKTQIKELEEEK